MNDGNCLESVLIPSLSVGCSGIYFSSSCEVNSNRHSGCDRHISLTYPTESEMESGDKITTADETGYQTSPEYETWNADSEDDAPGYFDEFRNYLSRRTPPALLLGGTIGGTGAIFINAELWRYIVFDKDHFSLFSDLLFMQHPRVIMRVMQWRSMGILTVLDLVLSLLPSIQEFME